MNAAKKWPGAPAPPIWLELPSMIRIAASTGRNDCRNGPPGKRPLWLRSGILAVAGLALAISLAMPLALGFISGRPGARRQGISGAAESAGGGSDSSDGRAVSGQRTLARQVLSALGTTDELDPEDVQRAAAFLTGLETRVGTSYPVGGEGELAPPAISEKPALPRKTATGAAAIR